MDIRAVGQPITASQRRSYSQTPDSGFYQTFQSAFAAAGGRVEGTASGVSGAGPTSAEAFEAIVAGATRNYPSGRFAGVVQILQEDVGLIAACGGLASAGTAAAAWLKNSSSWSRTPAQKASASTASMGSPPAACPPSDDSGWPGACGLQQRSWHGCR